VKVEKIDNPEVDLNSKVRVKLMGNITEIMYSNNYSSKCSIEKLDKDNYILLETGEIKQFKKIENRGQDMGSVRKSLGRLRDYLNTNITDVSKCKWVTLTYRENMTDTKKLYDDFKKFNMRMRYFLKEKYEYIVAMEPQGRGAWHCHVVMIFDSSAPWINNEDMARIWGNGFTVTKKLDDVDNVGAYLTAYMGDMELSEVNSNPDVVGRSSGLEVNVIESDIDGKKSVKAYVKGARLFLYPPQFNLYRCSRGIKKPVIFYDIEENVQKKVSRAVLTFEKSIQLSDSENNFNKVINYRYYNSKRK